MTPASTAPAHSHSPGEARIGYPSPALASVAASPEPRTWLSCGVLMAIAMAPRLAIFPWNENLYGDAVSRTELSSRWLAAPHWISSFADGAFQFGPLHLYLIAALLKLWPSPEHAGRLLSLICGVLSVVPLFLLTRRLFGWKAGVWAALAFSVWGMHIQFSTTAASESLALFLVLATLSLFAAGLEDGRFAPIGYAGLVLNLACATRYEAWLLIPLLGVVLLLADPDRVAAVTRATFFVLLCLPFPLVWMQGNEVATGSPFAAIAHIESFHQAWVNEGISRWGPILYRLQNLFFWPGVAVVTLSPLVAFFGFVGMRTAWKESPRHRWVLWIIVIPTAYFTIRSAVLLSFQPLGRFATTEIALILPYVYVGFLAIAGGISANKRRMLAAVTIGSAVAVPLWLGAFTFRNQGKFQNSLRPISPTSTNSPAVMEVARFIRQQVGPKGGGIILDTDSEYRDMQIAFFAGLPEEKMARYRWDTFQKRLLTAQPVHLIRIEGGQLGENEEFQLVGNRVRLGDRWFEELPGFKPPFHVYRPL